MTMRCLPNSTPSFRDKLVDNILLVLFTTVKCKLFLYSLKKNSVPSLILSCDISKFRVAQNFAHCFEYVIYCCHVPAVQEFKITSLNSLLKELGVDQLRRLVSSICLLLDVSLFLWKKIYIVLTDIPISLE